MKIFVKPSGIEVPVNSSSEAHALQLGWKPKESVPEVPVEVPEESTEPRQKRKYTRRVE